MGDDLPAAMCGGVRLRDASVVLSGPGRILQTSTNEAIEQLDARCRQQTYHRLNQLHQAFMRHFCKK